MQRRLNEPRTSDDFSELKCDDVLLGRFPISENPRPRVGARQCHGSFSGKCHLQTPNAVMCCWDETRRAALSCPERPHDRPAGAKTISTFSKVWGASPPVYRSVRSAVPLLRGGGATGAGAHQGQTSREGEKDIWWTARTARGGTGHLGLTETQRGRLWTACGQRCVDSKNSQTTPATTSTSSIRQLLGAADAQTTSAGAPAAAVDRTQRPDATCEGENG